MSERVHTLVRDALIDRLESIAGDFGTTYWYTPSKVIFYPAFTEDLLDESVGNPATIYVVSPGPRQKQPFTFGKVLTIATFDITCAQRYRDSESAFSPPDVDRGKIQDRMTGDVEKALLKDFASDAGTVFGRSDVHGVDVGSVDVTAENTWHESWALAFMPVQVHYTYAETTP